MTLVLCPCYAQGQGSVSLISTVKSRALEGLYYRYLIVRYLVPGNRSYTNVCRAKSQIFWRGRVQAPFLWRGWASLYVPGTVQPIRSTSDSVDCTWYSITSNAGPIITWHLGTTTVPVAELLLWYLPGSYVPGGTRYRATLPMGRALI